MDLTQQQKDYMASLGVKPTGKPLVSSQPEDDFDTNEFLAGVRQRTGISSEQAIADKVANSSYLGRIGQKYEERGAQAIETLGRANEQSDFSTGVQLGGSALGLATDVAQETVESIPGVKTAMKVASYTPPIQVLRKNLENIKQLLGPSYDTLAQEHPEAARNLESLMEAVKFAGTAVSGRQLAEASPSLLKKGVSMIEQAPTKAGELWNKAKTALTPKTEAQILATPKEMVGKLSPRDADIWLKNEERLTAQKLAEESDVAKGAISQEEEMAKKALGEESESMRLASDLEKKRLQEKTMEEKARIEKRYKEGEQQITETSDEVTERLKKEQADLATKLKEKSREKVIAAREPIIQTMRKSGDEYVRLVDKEMAGKEALPATSDEIGASIDRFYGEDLARAAEVKAQFGIKPGEAFNTTIGELYAKAKRMRQGISSASKGGSRVYTPVEKLTEDTVASLVRYMKEKGIDLSEANNFWSQWAPLRNKAVSTFRPFDVTETSANIGATRLKQAVLGKDADTATLVKKLEEMTGEDLTSEMKGIVSQMSTNERRLFIEKYNAEQARITNKLALEQEKDLAKSIKEMEESKLSKKTEAAEREFSKKQEDRMKELSEKKNLTEKELAEKKRLAEDQGRSFRIEAERQALTRQWIKRALGVLGVGTTGQLLFEEAKKRF